MKLLPESMFGRLFLATCVPIVVMLGLSYALVARDRLLLAQRLSGSNTTVARVMVALDRLRPLQGESRDAAIEAVNSAPLILDSAAGGGPPAADRLADVESMYLRPLRQQLGAHCRVAASRAAARSDRFVNLARPPSAPPPVALTRPMSAEPPSGGRGLYDLTVTCADVAPVVFRVPAPPDRPQIDSRLVWQLLGLAAMLGGVLYWATRRLTRPLVELQQAANAVGQAAIPQRLVETGAREIRESLRAFNLMQDRLRRYLDSRTRVLAAMSHDLRTPLTRLRLRVESVAGEEIRERLVADIEEMDTLVHRSLGMFRGLNDEESLVVTDVNALIAALAEEFTDLGHTVTIEGTVGAPLAVRPQALRRALRNLIDNACKYGAAATIRLSDGQQVAIAIGDRGPGIPVELLEAVFEPFRRLEHSRNRDTGGIGLGLSIARDIAELHGGSLVLRNRPEGGLEALLELPRTTTS